MGELELAEAIANLRVDQANIRGEMAVIKAQHISIQADLDEKHRQNRSSIHELRNLLQKIVDKLHLIELKQARNSVLSGGAVAVIVEIIRSIWKH